jgi:hypothetical protein
VCENVTKVSSKGVTAVEKSTSDPKSRSRTWIATVVTIECGERGSGEKKYRRPFETKSDSWYHNLIMVE